MSASPQAPSGQGNPLWSRLALDAPSWIASSGLQRRLAVFLEPIPSVVSRVENDQFQDGSLDNLVSDFARICLVEPPDLCLTLWLGGE